jgi:hypothetical protein
MLDTVSMMDSHQVEGQKDSLLRCRRIPSVIERELASESLDWTLPQRALDAIREGMRLLSWSPCSCRRAELGNGRSREFIVPFGDTG